MDLREYAARMIHPLIRVLDTSPELRPVAMNTLTAIASQMGSKFCIFIPAVFKVLNKHRISDIKYECVINRIQVGGLSVFDLTLVQLHLSEPPPHTPPTMPDEP